MFFFGFLVQKAVCRTFIAPATVDSLVINKNKRQVKAKTKEGNDNCIKNHYMSLEDQVQFMIDGFLDGFLLEKVIIVRRAWEGVNE